MELWEFHARMDGFQRMQEEEYNQIRLTCSILLQAHIKKGKKLKPSDIFTLPSEQVKQKKISKEELKESLDNFIRDLNV